VRSAEAAQEQSYDECMDHYNRVSPTRHTHMHKCTNIIRAVQ